MTASETPAPESPQSRPRLYLAAPLFSESELAFNKKLKNELSPYFRIYLPQEDGLLLVDAVRRGEGASNAARRIFVADTAAIAACDAVVALLDGRSIDEGVAFELGYAYAIGKACVGLQTDPRRLLPSGNNPMIEGALHHVFHTIPELVEWASRYG